MGRTLFGTKNIYSKRYQSGGLYEPPYLEVSILLKGVLFFKNFFVGNEI